jgi:DNA polymerase III delta subunit
MITLLTGENSFEVESELGQLVAAFDGTPEKFDGAELEARQLPDLLMGMSLFAEKRLVIIRGLSGSKQAWSALPELMERMSDDIHLVLVESSPDKRTKTYKALQKSAEIKEFSPWTERDSGKAERWAVAEAKQMGVKLDTPSARLIVQRSLIMPEKGQPVIDQWRIINSLEKLSVLNEVTVEAVEKYIDVQPVESVFTLLETALKGNLPVLRRLLDDLEPSEDPFKVFGLLTSQAFQLAALAVTDQSPNETAKAIGAHPFVAGKLAPLARRLGQGGAKKTVLILAKADEDMKVSKAAPWVLIDQALMKIALVSPK